MTRPFCFGSHCNPKADTHERFKVERPSASIVKATPAYPGTHDPELISRYGTYCRSCAERASTTLLKRKAKGRLTPFAPHSASALRVGGNVGRSSQAQIPRRRDMAHYEIVTRFENRLGQLGDWTPEGIGEPNEFETEQEAREAIEQLRTLGAEWASAEYDVRPIEN